MSVDMDTDAVERIARQLTAIGEDMQRDWTRFRNAVQTAEGGIGTGLLGAAFRAEYTPAADAVRQYADPLPGWWSRFGDAGSSAARVYDAADRAAAGGFPR